MTHRWGRLSMGALAVAAVLLLPSLAVFWVVLVLLTGCAFEYAALARRVEPAFPRALLVVARPGWPLVHADELRAALKLPSEAPLRLEAVEAPLIDIASRDLRRRAAEGRSIRYLLPRAWLDTAGANDLLVFDEHGGNATKTRLVVGGGVGAFG